MWPADAYLVVFSWIVHLIPEGVCLLVYKWWFLPPSIPTKRYRILFPPMAPCSICLYIFSLAKFFFSTFYLDRKTPEVFLVGKSGRGMLLREQAIREESRFSGSSLAPLSMILSPAQRHDRHRVGTCKEVGKLSPVLTRPDPVVLVEHKTLRLSFTLTSFIFYSHFCQFEPYAMIFFSSIYHQIKEFLFKLYSQINNVLWSTHVKS